MQQHDTHPKHFHRVGLSIFARIKYPEAFPEDAPINSPLGKAHRQITRAVLHGGSHAIPLPRGQTTATARATAEWAAFIGQDFPGRRRNPMLLTAESVLDKLLIDTFPFPGLVVVDDPIPDIHAVGVDDLVEHIAVALPRLGQPKRHTAVVLIAPPEVCALFIAKGWSTIPEEP